MTIEEAKATFMEMAKNCAAETGATPGNNKIKIYKLSKIQKLIIM